MTPTTSALGPVPGLSVTIICCNNETTIGRTLESVRGLAAEIIAVDSGSTDGTLAMLEAAGAKIIHQPWLGFVRQTRFALEQCAGPWVLHLDSDESIDAAMAESIRATVSRDDPAIAGGWCNRMTYYAGHPLRHAWQPEWRLRLARRDRARWDGIDPHYEMMVDGGHTTRLAGTMRHDAISSAADMLARQVSHARVSAAALHAAGHRGSVVRLITSPPAAWLKQVVGRRAFRDGWRGFVAASITAAAALMKHAVLLELSRRDAGGAPED